MRVLSICLCSAIGVSLTAYTVHLAWDVHTTRAARIQHETEPIVNVTWDCRRLPDRTSEALAGVLHFAKRFDCRAERGEAGEFVFTFSVRGLLDKAMAFSELGDGADEPDVSEVVRIWAPSPEDADLSDLDAYTEESDRFLQFELPRDPSERQSRIEYLRRWALDHVESGSVGHVEDLLTRYQVRVSSFRPDDGPFIVQVEGFGHLPPLTPFARSDSADVRWVLQHE